MGGTMTLVGQKAQAVDVNSNNNHSRIVWTHCEPINQIGLVLCIIMHDIEK